MNYNFYPTNVQSDSEFSGVQFDYDVIAWAELPEVDYEKI